MIQARQPKEGDAFQVDPVCSGDDLPLFADCSDRITEVGSFAVDAVGASVITLLPSERMDLRPEPMAVE